MCSPHSLPNFPPFFYSLNWCLKHSCFQAPYWMLLRDEKNLQKYCIFLKTDSNFGLTSRWLASRSTGVVLSQWWPFWNFLPKNFTIWQLASFLLLIENSEFRREFRLANTFGLGNEAQGSYFQYLLSRCSITTVYFWHFENVELS